MREIWLYTGTRKGSSLFIEVLRRGSSPAIIEIETKGLRNSPIAFLNHVAYVILEDAFNAIIAKANAKRFCREVVVRFRRSGWSIAHDDIVLWHRTRGIKVSITDQDCEGK